jgi:hypothetical protein
MEVGIGIEVVLFAMQYSSGRHLTSIARLSIHHGDKEK